MGLRVLTVLSWCKWPAAEVDSTELHAEAIGHSERLHPLLDLGLAGKELNSLVGTQL